MGTRLSAALLAIAAICLTAGDAGFAADSRLELSPCRPPGVEETLRCGDLLVAENPQQPSGRKIKLHVVVLPALDGKGGAPPLFDLAGGPGIGATGAAGFYATDGRIHRRERDVVLVDQRGTGESSPLRCQELELGNPRDRMYPPEMVKRCRLTLEKQAHLAQYTTANAAGDLDLVRAGLGYSRIDLSGLSYGTRLALAYMRLHPAHVRSAVLIGTVRDEEKMPLSHARNAQVVLDRLFDQCMSEAACHGAFPNLRQEWQSLLDSLQVKPVSTSGVVQGREVPVVMRRGPFAEAFRPLLLTTGSQIRVPYVIHRMSLGDFRPFLGATLSGGGEISEGLYLSVVCAEDTPRITSAEREAATTHTFLGTYRIDEQAGACREWNIPLAATPTASVKNPDVPILLLAGEMDYVTPAAWAREVAASFPRSRVVEVPKLGHFPDGLEHMECLEEMIASFFKHGDAGEVDSSCVKSMTRPPFVLSEKSATP
jgi:pimeloyl-ACP methyl ester carboxylesterase